MVQGPSFDQMIVPEIKDRKFMGHRMAQTPEALLVFNEIFSREKFSKIIEIGTFFGGFALFLACCAKAKSMKFYTFDIQKRNTNAYNKIKQLGGVYFNLNVFEQQGKQKVKSLIQSPGRILLLCDGGDKRREIKTFAQFLKSKDVIMGHDYFRKSQDFFLQDKWLACQLVEDDIRPTCEEHGLIPWYENILKEVFWAGRMKR